MPNSLYDRIIVPLDGSELAEAALPTAMTLAGSFGLPVLLIRIVDYAKLERYGPYGLALEYEAFEPVVGREESDAGDYLAEMQKRYKPEGVKIETEVRRGAVARDLIELAGPRDLIVLASHGRGAIARWLLGSVTEDIVRNGASPLLLVRTSQTESEES